MSASFATAAARTFPALLGGRLPEARPPAAATRRLAAGSREPLVRIVDGDGAMRERLQALLATVGLESAAYASVDEVWAADRDILRPGCFLMEVRLNGCSGLELQRELGRRGLKTPVVFLTAHGDIAMSVEAMKAGAVDFLAKPSRDQEILEAVAAGVERDLAQHAAATDAQAKLALVSLLTPREREVLREVAGGRMNKQIAFDLGISEVTVKLHRGNVMRKLGMRGSSELIRFWDAMSAFGAPMAA